MTLAAPDPAALTTLMSNLNHCLSNDLAKSIVSGLPAVLDELRSMLSVGNVGAEAARQQVPVIEPLIDFFSRVREPLVTVKTSGLLSDPWGAAALQRDEVRNASVLRWFLDPRGDHGCGDALLVDLLSRVWGTLPHGFPRRPSSGCWVSVEECPDGDRASRVDIQIDDPTFFIVVEVKIDASEQRDQIARYCDIAAARAANVRPWAVVFLTIDGRPPMTAGKWADHVVAVSWGNLAASLRKAARDAAPVPRFLATSFAAHISNL